MSESKACPPLFGSLLSLAYFLVPFSFWVCTFLTAILQGERPGYEYSTLLSETQQSRGDDSPMGPIRLRERKRERGQMHQEMGSSLKTDFTCLEQYSPA